jgi:hypothetical protein
VLVRRRRDISGNHKVRQETRQTIAKANETGNRTNQHFNELRSARFATHLKQRPVPRDWVAGSNPVFAQTQKLDRGSGPLWCNIERDRSHLSPVCWDAAKRPKEQGVVPCSWLLLDTLGIMLKYSLSVVWW